MSASASNLKNQPGTKPAPPLNTAVNWLNVISDVRLMPFIIWMFDTSLTSEITYSQFTAVFSGGAGFVPGWFFKLLALALIWAYLHHFIAGVRHLWMDATHAVTLEFGRQSAVFTLVTSVALTLALGAKLFFF